MMPLQFRHYQLFEEIFNDVSMELYILRNFIFLYIFSFVEQFFLVCVVLTFSETLLLCL